MKEKDQEMNEIVITRLFDAPGEQVWKAWTEPVRLMHWWGPKGFTNIWKGRCHPAEKMPILDLLQDSRLRRITHIPD